MESNREEINESHRSLDFAGATVGMLNEFVIKDK